MPVKIPGLRPWRAILICITLAIPNTLVAQSTTESPLLNALNSGHSSDLRALIRGVDTRLQTTPAPFRDKVEALRYYERAIAADEKAGTSREWQSILKRSAAANILQDLNRPEASLKISRPLLDDLKTTHPNRHPAIFRTTYLVLGAQFQTKDWQAAISTARDLLALTEGMHAEHRAATRLLSHALYRSGHAADAIPHAETYLAMTSAIAAPNSRPLLEAEINLATLLIETGEPDRADNILKRLTPIIRRTLPKSDHIRLSAAYLAYRVAQKTGSIFTGRATMQTLVNETIGSGHPLLELGALEERAKIEGREGRLERLADTLREIVAHTRKYPQLSRIRMADALSMLAMFQALDQDFTGAWKGLAEARKLLIDNSDPDSIEWLEAQSKATTAAARFIARPLFPGELATLKKLARAYETNGDNVGAVFAGQDYAQYLGRAGKYDLAIAELERQIELWAIEEPKIAEKIAKNDNLITRSMNVPDIAVSLKLELGMLQVDAGQFEAAVDTFAKSVDDAMEYRRSTRQTIAGTGMDHFAETTLVFGQYYATALWHASREVSPVDQQSYIARAFEALQIAAHGPAAEAVARANIRKRANDPTLTRSLKEWERLANFDGGLSLGKNGMSVRKMAENLERAKRMGELQVEIAKRFPDYFNLLVPAPVPLSDILAPKDGPGLIRDNEAVIAILPYKRISSGADVKGLVIALTQTGMAWAELGITSRSLSTRSAELHAALDPEDALSRAPLSQTTPAPNRPPDFPVKQSAALYQALFGAPEIARLIDGKTNWTIIPIGSAISLPFATLVTSDENHDKAENAADFRQVNWLGLERALTIYPSVAVLKDLRRDTARPAHRRRYLAFGDPEFKPATLAMLDTAPTEPEKRDQDRAMAVASLPRLPGTRREVMALAALFDDTDTLTNLGSMASEENLRALDKSGDLKTAGIVHFATHGLLAGDVKGVGEPALALAPTPINDAANDGLLTASEISDLTLDADWVILSACNTAGGGQVNDAGLGALVQSFFGTGAQSLLVSHWRVDDAAAEQLISRTVAATENGIGKAEALRRAMQDVFHDTSRDSTGFSNAHPSIWAPFFMIGG